MGLLFISFLGIFPLLFFDVFFSVSLYTVKSAKNVTPRKQYLTLFNVLLKFFNQGHQESQHQKTAGS